VSVAAPTRIQLSRAKGWRMPENTVKVDRTTGFGNPFPVTKGTSSTMGKTTDIWSVGTWEGPAMWLRDSKEEATALSVKAFRSWIEAPAQEKLRCRAVIALRGKNLACWCKIGSPCHADVLLELANALLSAKGGETP
jgi:hypothetical protein